MIKNLTNKFLILSLLLLIAVTEGHTDEVAKRDFALKDFCPQGFGIDEDGLCRLKTLYQFYSSSQGRGVGGTQTSLPAHRDGFTPQQIDLGRYLFFDPILSSSKTVSCATCHRPEKGFTDGLAVSRGPNGVRGMRSAPSLWNSAFLTTFNWDASANSYEQQVQTPLFSELEMNNSPQQLLADLRQNDTYRQLFNVTFVDGITLKNIYTALAAFQSSLISLNSRYDQYAHGNHDALSKEEVEGLNVFRSFVARCSECHTPPLFTNNQVAVIGVPEIDNRPFDIGAENTFDLRKLRGGFKVPTLRNISSTAPYMHRGNFSTLREATEFYNKGRGHAIPENNHLYIHWHITSPDLQDNEIDLLVTFMKSLSDERFMPELPTEVPSGLSIEIVTDYKHKSTGSFNTALNH